MSEQGGALTPVVVSTEPPQGGPALRVVGYTTAPAGRPVQGGPALPVYVVSAAEVAAGYPVQGNVPVPLVLASAVGQPLTTGARPIPVVVVSGSLDPTPPTPGDPLTTEAGDELTTEAGDPITTEV